VLRRATLIVGVAAGLLLLFSGSASAVQPYAINFQTVDFNTGTLSGLVFQDGALQLEGDGSDTFQYTDPFSSVPVLGQNVDGSGAYASGTWTSEVYPMNFAFNELVSSWNAQTTPGTFVQSEVKPQLNNGRWAKWYILGRWTYNDSEFHRTSVGGRETRTGSSPSTPSSRRTIRRSRTGCG
jgi:hypothetical protein